MKKIIIEESKEGLEKLLGERVTLYCLNYIYCGDLKGVNDTCVLLENAGIVYNTGSHDSDSWEEYEKLPNDWYVKTNTIESFGIYKK